VTRKRRAVGRLKSFIDAQTPAFGTLPLVHGVFKESLTYFFYGRPAYRAKEGNNARLEFEWPIVLVFDPGKITAIKRVFPFDTGAYAMGLYNTFFDKRSELCDFELSPSVDSACKVVGTYYINNDEYYTGLTRKNVELPLRVFEASGLLELSRLPGVQASSSNTRDERSSAIELQVETPISLTDVLLAVILPTPYMDDAEIVEALTRWNVKNIRLYGTIHNTGGEAWVGQIYEIVRQLYRELGYL
jgi:hypothetical protein